MALILVLEYVEFGSATKRPGVGLKFSYQTLYKTLPMEAFHREVGFSGKHNPEDP